MSFNYDNIVKDSDPIVREKSVTVPIPMHEEDKELLMDMLQYVRDSQDSELAEKQNLRPAVGIAAIQLGIPKKMLAVVVPKDEEEDYEFALANPKIISESIQKKKNMKASFLELPALRSKALIYYVMKKS